MLRQQGCSQVSSSKHLLSSIPAQSSALLSVHVDIVLMVHCFLIVFNILLIRKQHDVAEVLCNQEELYSVLTVYRMGKN